MLIEVVLDGQGAVRVKANQVMTPKQIKGIIDHASATITQSQSDNEPREEYGFGACTGGDLSRGQIDQDPYEFGEVVR